MLRAGDPGSNPSPGENFSLKLLITLYIVNCFNKLLLINSTAYFSNYATKNTGDLVTYVLHCENYQPPCISVIIVVNFP